MVNSNLHQNNLLLQRYQLLEMVGEGAMGKVYRAEDTSGSGNIVAVKILTRALDEMRMIQRFQREATVSALLSERSPYIVQVMDYGVDNKKVPFYVMEFLSGESLADLIHVHTIPLEKFFAYARQICLAMETAHNGIYFQGEICPVIHRDLKPHNIFVLEDDEGRETIKVLDFGIAKIAHTEEENLDKFMGTPRYCSPEQLQGLPLDNRSDIYSLGMVLYEMLTKKYPWNLERESVTDWYNAHTKETPSGFPSELNIPQQLEELVMSCLAKIPHQRPQSAGEIVQKLDSISRQLNLKTDRYTMPSDHSAVIINEPESGRDNQLKPHSQLEELYLQTQWPSNKPQQKIVFPRVTPFHDKSAVSLWSMLEPEDIERRKDNIIYNQFVFQSYPHPMILWITVLFAQEYGARWLPCYLDLKTNIGQKVTKILGESKDYHLVIFALNQPRQCQYVSPIKVALKQRTNLIQWLKVANMLDIKDKTQAIEAKKKLKEDFEDMKRKIILDIQKSNTMQIHG